jgi:hypothetical protein
VVKLEEWYPAIPAEEICALRTDHYAATADKKRIKRLYILQPLIDFPQMSQIPQIDRLPILKHNAIKSQP